MTAPSITWDGLRNALVSLSVERKLFGGIPLPVDGLDLILEEKRPDQEWARFRFRDDPRQANFECSHEDVDEREQIRNKWFSHSTRSSVWIVWKGLPGEPGFKVEAVKEPWGWYQEALGKLTMTMDTLSAAVGAYGFDAEMRALAKLAGLVGEHRFNLYVMTGVLAETSKRSGVSYLFRRLRPTIALKTPCDGEKLHFLAALCMHPIGYYGNTWAGAMVPTDDLIAHLLLMRADEHLFWRRCNQHTIDAKEAGL